VSSSGFVVTAVLSRLGLNEVSRTDVQSVIDRNACFN
jgi:hypothetical protein